MHFDGGGGAGPRIELPALHVIGPDGTTDDESRGSAADERCGGDDVVALPQRYQLEQLSADGCCGGNNGGGGGAETLSIAARVEDAEIALSWIRNQLKLLKTQDAALVNRFQDIQKAIQLARCCPSPYSSTSSVNDCYSSGGSSSRVDVAYLRDSCEVEFRPRTSSLLVPRRNCDSGFGDIGGGAADFRVRTNSLLSPASTCRLPKTLETVVLQTSSADNLRCSAPCATRH